MTAQTKTYLTARFETGDTPTGSDFADLVDSYLNLADTTAQTIASNIQAPTVIVTSLLTAAAVNSPTIDSTAVSGATVNANTLHVVASAAVRGPISFSGAITASGAASFQGVVNVPGSLAATSAASFGGAIAVSGRMTMSEYLIESITASVAALGTTQGSAAPLGATGIHYILSCTTAAADGVRLGGGYPGLVQYILNGTTQSAQVWPPTGGNIDNLSANAARGLAGLGRMIVWHISSTQFVGMRGAV